MVVALVLKFPISGLSYVIFVFLVRDFYIIKENSLILRKSAKSATINIMYWINFEIRSGLKFILSYGINKSDDFGNTLRYDVCLVTVGIQNVIEKPKTYFLRHNCESLFFMSISNLGCL